MSGCGSSSSLPCRFGRCLHGFIAPIVDIDILRRVASRTKHGPGGTGLDGPCEADCLKCDVEKILRAHEAYVRSVELGQDGAG